MSKRAQELAREIELDGDATVEDNARFIASSAMDKKGLDPVIIDVRGKASYADYLVVVTGRNDRHVGAIADAIDDDISPYVDLRGREGLAGGHWVLLDYGDVVVHVFYAPVRKLYDIEGLWVDAPKVEVEIPDELRGDTMLYEGYSDH